MESLAVSDVGGSAGTADEIRRSAVRLGAIPKSSCSVVDVGYDSAGVERRWLSGNSEVVESRLLVDNSDAVGRQSL